MNTSQRDPRELRVYSESEFRQLCEMAEYEAEQRRIASLTPAQAMNEQFARMAARYGAANKSKE